ncbi:translation initiation factor eIF 4e-like domain-containing protein [Emericellopsis atlantica]|uniref:Translation initiation factor eIF 4e-like domain-containing protein n=1 Tax=Emericellopsis atlantica TaxID=2614577 RepID=A0A9P7ZP70_9HYPO|nr:translation initiation factor eIF 4e-like domain-containing protein [Emericellopsis atlantica]KAG9255322.1 translation initiation factor eIF 4e-like domain-containing protein [Emericellopsis atlantica]
MSSRPQLSAFTRGLSALSQSQSADGANSPAEQRDDAKRNFLKTMRPLPTQHYWHVYFDRQNKEAAADGQEYNAELEQLGSQIESVQDFWRYNNNTPVDMIKMRESIYLFKSGFRPVWEDRRNLNGGSWTFRVPKASGPDVWTRVQLLAIGEVLEAALDKDDQLCGVGLSVRFNSHLISIWHRDSSKQNSIDGIFACVMEQLPEELRPKEDGCFYKKHADHPGFNPPPELRAVLDSQRRAAEQKAAGGDDADENVPAAEGQPEVKVDSMQ